ncbi:hypothetical protein NA57DRAFT_81215 [Rhizodiscina lignyota]|uniref:Fungal N-terminal domain-containing protein n=1 Tax=Rhizodiscina lignyota TaxID=1504668 RepID=A0A9P4I697_9PEZI|nr:hypothetical protein NA57DRAFT_81215 [Rhizodiscina lignyota]
MAEILGTLVGVISFGITVCDGLTAYYQAWEARDDDVSSALKYIAHLGKLFKLLNSRLGNILNTHPLFNDYVADSLSLVEDKLKTLEAILKNCRIECPKGTKERFIDLSKKSAYPFRKKTIKHLQALVRDLTHNLSLLLQVLQLDIAANQEITVTAVANTGSSTMKDVNHIKQTVSSIEHVITNDIVSNLHTTKDFRQQFELLQDAVMRVTPQMSEMTEQLLKRFAENSTKDKATEQDMQLTLIPRPAILQPAVDSTSTLDNSLSLRQNSLQNDFIAKSISPRCSCRKWKTKMVNEIRRGPLRIFRETIASSSHHESCPYHLNTERVTRIGVDARIFSILLSRVVEGSFSVAFGAWSFSIIPSLSLRYVFRPDSPAFQLLKGLGEHGNKGRTFEMSHEDLRAEIQRLFHSRQASPFDVDQNGRTLLNTLVQGDCPGHWRAVSDLLPYTGLVFDLADAGVPINEKDSRGRNPFDCLAISTWNAHILHPEYGRSAIDFCKSVVDIGFEHSASLLTTYFFKNRDRYEIEVGRHLDAWIEGM